MEENAKSVKRNRRPSCGSNCCVVECSNTYTNKSNIRMFCFPNRQKDPLRRHKWIQAVRRINIDGTPWIPSKWSRVCSDHFIGGFPVYHPDNPDYIPSQFPDVYKKMSSAASVHRFRRREERRNRAQKMQDVSTLSPQLEMSIGLPTTVQTMESDQHDSNFPCTCEQSGLDVKTSAAIPYTDCKTRDPAEEENSYLQVCKKDEGSTQRLLAYLKSTPHVCLVCKKEFVLEDSLKSHVCCPEKSTMDVAPEDATKLTGKVRSERGKYYLCQLCDKAFERQETLNNHVRQQHMMGNHVACTFCCRSFSSLYHLKMHERKHMARKPVLCPFCGEQFKTTYKFNVHLRECHQKAVPPPSRSYVCKLCHQEFSERSLFVVHRKDHNKDKLLTCQYCRKIFLLDCELEDHIQDEHENAYILGL